MKCKIKKWGINGEGIGYLHHKPVFVSGAIPGELVDLQELKEEKKYINAKMCKVLEPSTHRRNPTCRENMCEGCALMHVDYKGQCQMKVATLKQALSKYADYHRKIKPLVKNDSVFGYRNSCKMPVRMVKNKLSCGMYQNDSQNFVPISHCIVHEKELEHARRQLMEVLQNSDYQEYDIQTKTGLRSIVLKAFSNRVQVILVTGKEKISTELVEQILSIPHVVSLWQSIKVNKGLDVFGDTMNFLGGQEKLQIQIDDLSLSLLPRSFFQLNTGQAIKLYRYVCQQIRPCKTLVEAYSGIGTMSLMARNKADRIYGVEWIQDAVDNANENARNNHIDNVSFVRKDAGEFLLNFHKKVDCLLVDPPRSGLDETMRQAIDKARPSQIVYVSCNPSTLAKDIDRLKDSYRIQSVQPFDLFSQTQHVETVVDLVRI